MTSTAQALEAMVPEKLAPRGSGPDLYQATLDAFRGTAEGVRAVWDKHLAVAEKSVRDWVEKGGLDYKADGYRQVVDALPDVSASVKEWSRLRERSPFDRPALESVADRLHRELTQVLEHVAGSDPRLPRDSRALIDVAVEALAAELADQVRAAADPIGTSAAELDALSAPLGQSRQRFDAMLNDQTPDAVWKNVKAAMLKNLTKADKSLAAKVDKAMDSGLRSTLAGLSSAADNFDGRKVLRANHEVAVIVDSYDRRLKALDDAAQSGVQASGYITAMREALRAIAASVADNTRYLADVGVLDDGR